MSSILVSRSKITRKEGCGNLPMHLADGRVRGKMWAATLSYLFFATPPHCPMSSETRGGGENVTFLSLSREIAAITVLNITPLSKQ
jgi:hypothetical protein